MALRALKLGETDAISVVDGDYLWDERNHMNTTLRFLNTPSAMITQAERPEIKVLALPEGYQLSEHVAQPSAARADIVAVPKHSTAARAHTATIFFFICSTPLPICIHPYQPCFRRG